MPIPVVWDGVKLPEGYRADMILEGALLLEIKSLEVLAPVHYKQVLTYLKCAGLRLALLINFGEEHLRDGIKRIANRFEE